MRITGALVKHGGRGGQAERAQRACIRSGVNLILESVSGQISLTSAVRQRLSQALAQPVLLFKQVHQVGAKTCVLPNGRAQKVPILPQQPCPVGVAQSIRTRHGLTYTDPFVARGGSLQKPSSVRPTSTWNFTKQGLVEGPLMNLIGKGKYRASRFTRRTVHWKTKRSFPSLEGALGSSDVGCNFLPRLQYRSQDWLPLPGRESRTMPDSIVDVGSLRLGWQARQASIIP
jgi:hypothetical protein